MSAKVGADVESICGKCGDVWHVVVAKVGEKVAKVQCKQCGAVHRYRPPEKDNPMKTPRAAGSKPPPARASKAPRAAAKKDDGPLVPFDATQTGRRYRPIDTYKVGELLEHPTFGRGVVEVIPDATKIQVWFEGRELLPSERRTLVHARAGAAPVSNAPPLPERRRPGAGGEE